MPACPRLRLCVERWKRSALKEDALRAPSPSTVKLLSKGSVESERGYFLLVMKQRSIYPPALAAFDTNVSCDSHIRKG